MHKSGRSSIGLGIATDADTDAAAAALSVSFTSLFAWLGGDANQCGWQASLSLVIGPLGSGGVVKSTSFLCMTLVSKTPDNPIRIKHGMGPAPGDKFR